MGAVDGVRVVDLTAAGADSLSTLLDAADPTAAVGTLMAAAKVGHSLDTIELLPPVERQEIWAAGVTYLRSKAARMEESDFGATAYDRVYEAARPEIFFKALAEKVVGPSDAVGIRHDSTWSVPDESFTLRPGDRVMLTIDGIGTLANHVIAV